MKKGKVKFCWNNEGLVRTESCKNLKEFLNQRKRWASKSLFYNDKYLILRLIMIFLFYAGLIIQPVLILVGFQFIWITFLLGLVIKILIEFLIIKRGREVFPRRNNFAVFLLTELLHVPYILITALLGLYGNFEWKERKIKR
jgi:cellulose synthase/poly-beta-1,6-N-acetylglucosamine synthase-like glycosyltransferase